MNDALALKDILQKTLQQESWKLVLLAEWPTIMGSLAKRVQIERIDGSTLILGVQHASWMQELYLLSTVLLKTINTHLGKTYIQKLVFKTSGSKKKTTTPQERKPVYIKPQVVPLTFAQKQALAAIKDPELQQSLREFFYRCMQKGDTQGTLL